MANNKVIFGNETVMDITDSTVTPENLLSGETAYDASGQKITGNVTVPTKLSDLSDDATHRLVTDTEKSTWNGKISDNPTFSQASSRANIESGESFATILGKIKKFFADLKNVAFSGNASDLTQDASNRLVTDTEKTTWNSKSDLQLGTTSTTAAPGAHLHLPKLESSSATSSNINLAANTMYDLKICSTDQSMAITFPFKTPPDNDTTYSAGTGISLSGTTFSNSGVRAVSISGNHLRVNTNGTNSDLTIPYASSAGSATDSTKEPKLSWTNDGYWKYYKDSAGYYHMFYDAELTLNFSNAYKTNVYIPDVWYVNFPKSLSGAKGIEVTTRYSSDIMGASIHSITSSRLGVWFWRCNSGSIKFGVSISLIGW